MSDWEKLTEEQKDAIDIFRRRMGVILQEQTKEFEGLHPDLRLTWYFNCDALLQGQHDTLGSKSSEEQKALLENFRIEIQQGPGMA